MTGPQFWKVRLAKGSAYSALKIWFGPPIDPTNGMPMWDRSPIWRAILNGEHVPIADVMVEIDGTTKMPVIKGDACDEIEYLRVLQTHLLAKKHDLPWPEARPRERIDVTKMAPIKFNA